MATLLKKLKYIDGVHVWQARVDLASKIHQLIVKGEAIVLEKQWHDRFKSENLKHYPLNIEKDHGPKTKDWRDQDTNELWITYDDCRQIYVGVDGNNIICDLTIFNGDNWDGGRKDKKWSAKLKIKAKHLLLFKSHIDDRFKGRMLDLYEKEEDLKRENRVKELSIEVFN